MQPIWRIAILSAAMNLILFAAPSRSAAPQAQPNGPQGFNYCAAENEICVFSGAQDVAFGANGHFNYKKGVTETISYDDPTFGDPLVGVVKACFVTGDQHHAAQSQPPQGYSFCANENQTCSFSGTQSVAFGANGIFRSRNGVTGGIECGAETFGGDPIVGVVKACYVTNVPANSPAITEAPTTPLPSPSPDDHGAESTTATTRANSAALSKSQAEEIVKQAHSLFYENRHAEAMALYRKAADAGYSPAEVTLGLMYLYGSAGPKDPDQGILWLRKAADAGDTNAGYVLGSVYQQGVGVSPDRALAIFWYRKTANLPDPNHSFNPGNACFQLGTIYENGTSPDYTQALYWYQRSANTGNPEAQDRLGLMYQDGEDVAKDHSKAIFWTKKAADQNYAPAAQQLAKLQGSAAPSPSPSSPQDAELERERAAWASQISQSCQAAAGQATQSQVVDVRFTPPETRIITDEEFADLKQGLHYSPPCAPLTQGGSASTTLLDGAGRAMASITVQWLKSSGPPSAPTGTFRVTLQNISNCEISPEVTLGIPGSAIGADAVGFATWGKWVALHDPSGGESQAFDGTTTLSGSYSTLLLLAKNPEGSLSQCRTKGQQIVDTAWQTQDVQYNSQNGQAHIRYKESVSIDAGTVTENTDSTVQFIGNTGDYECQGPCTHEDLWTNSMAISDILAIDEGPYLGDDLKSDANDLWVVNLHSRDMGVATQGHVISGCTGTCADADTHSVAISIFFNDEGAALAAKQALLAVASGH
jgi:spore coat protein U-like protein